MVLSLNSTQEVSLSFLIEVSLLSKPEVQAMVG